jgi:hypothetical protein
MLGSGVLRLEEGVPFSGQNVHHTSIKTRRVARAKRHNAEAVLHIIGRKESELVLVAVTDSDLMIAAASVEANEIQFPSGVAEVVNRIFAARDGIFERKGNAVEFPIRDAHAPDEIVDIDNIFLMRLGSENHKGTPRAITFPNPTVGKEHLLLFENNFGFVGPITRFATADGLGTASIDSEFEPKDGFANAGFVEDVPVLLDHHFDATTNGEVDMVADADMLFKLGSISSGIPKVNIGASRLEGGRKTTDRIAILGEDEQIVVDIVAVIQRNISVGWFGPPDLGRNINHEGLGQGSSIRRRLAGDDAMVDVEDRHEWFGERRSGSGG